MTNVTTDFPNIRKLGTMDPSVASKVLRNEHPQIIAAVLSLQTHEVCSNILLGFTERLRNDIVLRISTIDPIMHRWLKVLDKSVGKSIENYEKDPNIKIDGMKLASNVLRHLTIPGMRQELTSDATCVSTYLDSTSPYIAGVSMLDSIREYDPELAQELIAGSFTFDDIWVYLSEKDLELVFAAIVEAELLSDLKCVIAASGNFTWDSKVGNYLLNSYGKDFHNRWCVSIDETVRKSILTLTKLRLRNLVIASMGEIMKVVHAMFSENLIEVKSNGG